MVQVLEPLVVQQIFDVPVHWARKKPLFRSNEDFPRTAFISSSIQYFLRETDEGAQDIMLRRVNAEESHPDFGHGLD